MQGARLLPYYQEAMSTGAYPKSCNDCRRRRPVHERIAMGCAYEEPGPSPALPFVLSRAGRPMLSWTPSVCPLYLGRLPALADLGMASRQWRHGTLAAWLGVAADEIPDDILAALAAYEAGGEEYAHDPHRPKGGS